MARLSWAALLLGLALALAGGPTLIAADEVDEGDVLVVTKDNFEEKIKGAKFALVRRPSSGHVFAPGIAPMRPLGGRQAMPHGAAARGAAARPPRGPRSGRLACP